MNASWKANWNSMGSPPNHASSTPTGPASVMPSASTMDSRVRMSAKMSASGKYRLYQFATRSEADIFVEILRSVCMGAQLSGVN